MEKSKSKFQPRKRGPKKAKSNLQAQLSIFSRAWQPQFPKRLALQLVAAGTQSYSASTGPAFSPFSIMEYLGTLPNWITQLYDIYRYSVVTGVEVTAIYTNNSTTIPSQLAIGSIPYIDLASLTFDQLVQMPGAIRRMQSIAGGMNRSTVTKKFAAFEQLGAPYFNKDYWVTSTQSASGSPIDTSFPVCVVAVADNNGGSAGTVTGTLEWRVVYHCVFFDPKPNS